MALKPEDIWHDILSSVEAYLADTGDWVNSKMLKLNNSKREFIVFSPKQYEDSQFSSRVSIRISYINASRSVRNRVASKYINEETRRALVKALIVSLLEYGNVQLFFNDPTSLIKRPAANIDGWHLQNEPQISVCLPASLASHTIQIIL